MWQTALTAWFTLVTLVGPGLCCCSMATLTAAHTAKSQPASTCLAKPANSCCEHDAPPLFKVPGKPKPATPKKCPCEQVKHYVAEALPGESPVGVELTTLLKWIELGLLNSYVEGSRVDPAAITTLDTSPHVPKLAGRSLLASYSVLRC